MGQNFLRLGTAQFHVSSDELFSLSPDIHPQQLNLLIGWRPKVFTGNRPHLLG